MQFLDGTHSIIEEYPGDLPVNYLNFLFSFQEWLNEHDLSRTKEVIVTSDWIYLYLADGNKPELRDILFGNLMHNVEKKIQLRKCECKYMDSEDWSKFNFRGLQGFTSI